MNCCLSQALQGDPEVSMQMHELRVSEARSDGERAAEVREEKIGALEQLVESEVRDCTSPQPSASAVVMCLAPLPWPALTGAGAEGARAASRGAAGAHPHGRPVVGAGGAERRRGRRR